MIIRRVTTVLSTQEDNARDAVRVISIVREVLNERSCSVPCMKSAAGDSQLWWPCCQVFLRTVVYTMKAEVIRTAHELRLHCCVPGQTVQHVLPLSRTLPRLTEFHSHWLKLVKRNEHCSERPAVFGESSFEGRLQVRQRIQQLAWLRIARAQGMEGGTGRPAIRQLYGVSSGHGLRGFGIEDRQCSFPCCHAGRALRRGCTQSKSPCFVKREDSTS